MSQRRQLPRTSKLPGHPAQGGDAFLGFKLIGHCPPGELFRKAHAASKGKVANFDNHAINQEIQGRPLLLNLPDAFFQLRLRMGCTQIGAYLETILPQEIQHLRLGAVRRIFNGADLVKEHIQLPGSRNRRVQISQCAGGSIPGIFQGLGCGLIVGIQRTQAHDALALHFQQPLVRNRQGHGADGSGLGQDGLAGYAVAPGGSLNQLALVVSQVQGQAVKFIFHIVLEVRLPSQLFRASNPVLQCANGLHLVHAPQPMQVGMLLEALQRLAAHPVGGGIRQHDAGFLFQLCQLIIKLIPLHVGDFRLVQHIVGIGGFVQPVYQCPHLRFKCAHSSSPSFTMGAIDRENSFTP